MKLLGPGFSIPLRGGLALLTAALACACAGGTARSVPGGAAEVPKVVQAGHAVMLSRYLARDVETGSLVRGALPRNGASLGGAPVPQAVATPTVPLSYYGGPVQNAPRVYFVFWGAQWQSTGDPSGVQTYATNFINAASGGKWLNDVLQYTDSNGEWAGNPAAMLAGSWVDTSTVPAVAHDAAIRTEALNAARHFSDVGGNVNYVIFLPTGIGADHFVVNNGPWCGWHTWRTNLQGRLIPYTVMPYQPDAGYSCGVGAVNNPGTLDGVSIILGHEIAETLTDPRISSVGSSPTAWEDVNGEEIGDKCSWTGLQNNPSAGNFPTQPLWNNGLMNCRQGRPTVP